MTDFSIHDARACQLGEGPLWHPEAKKLFWFDIMKRMLLCDDGAEWFFDRHVSAAGWLDENQLMIATETDLIKFNTKTGKQEVICPLEAEIAATRSNDGRADPWGGFWIGTMGKNAEPGMGAIYRYYRGELRKLYAPVAISNAICFSPNASHAFFTDSTTAQVKKVTLRENDGWPDGDPEIYLDLKSEGLTPDGAVVTTDGLFVNAQWGAARLACYDMQGSLQTTFDLPTDHITCPAFGGPNNQSLFATSALQGLSRNQKAEQSDAGKTFVIQTDLTGQPEHQVIL